MSATPWINDQSYITTLADAEDFVNPSWNPVNIFMSADTIKYTDATSWQFNPELHVFKIQHDGTSGQTLTIQLPILSKLYSESCIWFFWLNQGVDGAIVSFAALAGDEPINGTAGPDATFNFTCDGDRHLFMVIAVNGGYYIKMVQGRNFTVSAGTGTSVAIDLPDYAVSAFAGVPVQLPNITVAAATTYYGSNGVGNATEANVNGIMITQAGVISNLYIATSAAVTATSHTFTVRKGATYAALTDTTLTCAIATTALAGSDQTHSFTVAKGDIITIKDVQAGTPEALHAAISFCFKPSAV